MYIIYLYILYFHTTFFPPIPLTFYLFHLKCMTSSSICITVTHTKHKRTHVWCSFGHMIRSDPLEVDNISGGSSLEKVILLSLHQLIACIFSSNSGGACQISLWHGQRCCHHAGLVLANLLLRFRFHECNFSVMSYCLTVSVLVFRFLQFLKSPFWYKSLSFRCMRSIVDVQVGVVSPHSIFPNILICCVSL